MESARSGVEEISFRSKHSYFDVYRKYVPTREMANTLDRLRTVHEYGVALYPPLCAARCGANIAGFILPIGQVFGHSWHFRPGPMCRWRPGVHLSVHTTILLLVANRVKSVCPGDADHGRCKRKNE
jgi:hypothetical protein